MKADKIIFCCLFLTVIFCIGNKSFAQEQGTYKTAIGVRGGWSSGLSVKTFLSQRGAVEGIVSSRYRGFIVTGLFELNKPAFEIPRLNWFYGLGGHIGFFNGLYYKDREGNFYPDNTMTLGLDGILGLEYYFEEIPFTLGVDIKPFFDIVSPGYGYWDGAFTLRYAF